MTVRSAKMSGKIAIFSQETRVVIGIGENTAAARRDAANNCTAACRNIEALPISIDAIVKLKDEVWPLIAVFSDGSTGEFIGSNDQYDMEHTDHSHQADTHRRRGHPYWRAID